MHFLILFSQFLVASHAKEMQIVFPFLVRLRVVHFHPAFHPAFHHMCVPCAWRYSQQIIPKGICSWGKTNRNQGLNTCAMRRSLERALAVTLLFRREDKTLAMPLTPRTPVACRHRGI